MTKSTVEEIKKMFDTNPKLSKYKNNPILLEIAEKASKHWDNVAESISSLGVQLSNLQKENEELKEKVEAWHETDKELPSDMEEVFAYTKDKSMFKARFDYDENNWVIYLENRLLRYDKNEVLRWKRKV